MASEIYTGAERLLVSKAADQNARVYDTLGPSQIRLTKLSRTDSNTLACSLETFTLGDGCPGFDALSYTWGPPVKIRTPEAAAAGDEDHDDAPVLNYEITCNNAIIRVTENIFRACDQLQSDDPAGTYYWIDAICINQLDLTERVDQIQLMSHIFASAALVVVWLGWEHPLLEDFKLATDVITPNIEKALETRESSEFFSHDLVAREIKEILGVPNPLETLTSFLTFCDSCRWFKRAWVWQEVASARLLLMRCGPHILSWERAVNLCLYLRGGGWETQLLGWNLAWGSGTCKYTGTEIIPKAQARLLFVDPDDDNETPLVKQNIDALLCAEDKDTSALATLYWMITSIQALACLIPHDKIFSVMGLAKRCLNVTGLDTIPMDYRMPAEQLYQALTEMMLLRLKPLIGLNQIQDPGHRKMRHLPSWVPDYSSTYIHTGIIHVGTPGQYDPLPYPGGGLAPRRVDGSVFHCTGAVFDAVEHICSTVVVDHSGVVAINDILQLCAKIPEGVYKQSRAECVWRTLITDTVEAEHPAPTSIADGFWCMALMGAVNDVEVQLKGPKKRISDEELQEILAKLDSDVASGGLPSMADVQEFRNTLLRSIELYPEHGYDCPEGNRVIEIDRRLNVYARLFVQGLGRQRLFTTKRGYLGLGPNSVQPGDQVTFIYDSRTPMTLRQRENDSSFQLLGECYLHGYMHGEVLQDKAWNDAVGDIGIA